MNETPEYRLNRRYLGAIFVLWYYYGTMFLICFSLFSILYHFCGTIILSISLTIPSLCLSSSRAIESEVLG